MVGQGAVALFVKTPGLSPVKTRLAVKLGAAIAERFHVLAASATCAVLDAASRSCNVRGYYAVAEQAAACAEYWHEMPCLWQGDGGLGERMRRVYETLLENHEFVILVGADIPQMTVTELQSASEWLTHDEQARFAFGPSYDGGFWLFGGNGPLPTGLWTDVVYSRPETGMRFFEAIQRCGDVRTLTTLRDVDEPDDLIALDRVLQDLDRPLPEQLALMRFLHGLSPALREYRGLAANC
ncbi:MAG: TIGR04282 family arsenosugar biosynthesis glycosyltransferase [Methylomicrobium sp.]